VHGGSSRWQAVVVVVASSVVLVGHHKRNERKEGKHTLGHDRTVQVCRHLMCAAIDARCACMEM